MYAKSYVAYVALQHVWGIISSICSIVACMGNYAQHMQHCSMYAKSYVGYVSLQHVWGIIRNPPTSERDGHMGPSRDQRGKRMAATEYGTSRQATCDRCKRSFLNQQHRAPLTQDAILTGLTFGACHPLIIPWVPMEVSLERRVTMMTMGHRPFPRMFGGSIKISGGAIPDLQFFQIKISCPVIFENTLSQAAIKEKTCLLRPFRKSGAVP